MLLQLHHSESLNHRLSLSSKCSLIIIFIDPFLTLWCSVPHWIEYNLYFSALPTSSTLNHCGMMSLFPLHDLNKWKFLLKTLKLMTFNTNQHVSHHRGWRKQGVTSLMLLPRNSVVLPCLLYWWGHNFCIALWDICGCVYMMNFKPSLKMFGIHSGFRSYFPVFHSPWSKTWTWGSPAVNN